MKGLQTMRNMYVVSLEGSSSLFDLDTAMLSLSKDMYTLKYETSIQVNNRLNS